MHQAESKAWTPPIVEVHRRKTAILVLACRSPVYGKCIGAIRNTWGADSVPDVDVFYVYGGQSTAAIPDLIDIEELTGQPEPELEDKEVRARSDIILCGCADTIQEQQDCLLRKRLIAFDYLANEKKYDFIHTVCASSYVDIPELKKYTRELPLTGVYHGPVAVCESTGYPFVSGSSILLSRDMAASLANSFDDIIAVNKGAYADDVALGHWIARELCSESVSEICARIRTGRKVTDGQAFVLPYGKGLMNFVHKPVEEHLPSDEMYHYHFDSRCIWEMELFHRRFFKASDSNRGQNPSHRSG